MAKSYMSHEQQTCFLENGNRKGGNQYVTVVGRALLPKESRQGDGHYVQVESFQKAAVFYLLSISDILQVVFFLYPFENRDIYQQFNVVGKVNMRYLQGQKMGYGVWQMLWKTWTRDLDHLILIIIQDTKVQGKNMLTKSKNRRRSRRCDSCHTISAILCTTSELKGQRLYQKKVESKIFPTPTPTRKHTYL